MTTAANPPPGATPTNGAGDPFVGAGGAGPLRYASFDTDQFSLYASSSPSHAKRALEAHLKDTDRRIQDASRLGSTLLQQRKELSARLQDVEQVQPDTDVPAELRAKLAELEREYHEVGKESARAFLPKSRAAAGGDGSAGAGAAGAAAAAAAPAVLSGQARESPTKVSAPSRRQRNQPGSRVHDIEFATEISTSLLAQVRQLQAALAEKDEALQETTAAKAQLDADTAAMALKIKQMDEHEQRYKDEGWNLEMKVQELEAAHRDVSDKHDRLSQALKATQADEAAALRELDELKLAHELLLENHAGRQKQHEGELHGLRRDVASHQTETQTLQRKIEELTAQNTELARAVSSRWNQASQTTDSEFVSAAEDPLDDEYAPDLSEPASPVKGTPRHGMLESETLKSSLNHAHRMIQSLKNNIHREKTEKIELKRMLQDARDELEARRSDGGIGANVGKKRRANADNAKFKKPPRLDRLGAARGGTTEILADEPDWEDHDSELTPSRSQFAPVAAGPATVTAALVMADAEGGHDPTGLGSEGPESTDAFETATERGMTTETEAFETGNEELPDDDDSDLTETESHANHRATTLLGKGVSPLAARERGDRRSFQSTASTSADEAEDDVRTPVREQWPKYRLRISRGSRRSGKPGDLPMDSPTSSAGGTPQLGQSLGDELDALDDDGMDDTPGRTSEDFERTPETTREASAAPETPTKGAAADVSPKGPRADTAAAVAEHDDEHDDDSAAQLSSTVILAPPAAEHAVRADDAEAAAVPAPVPAPAVTSNYVDSGMMTDPWEPQQEARTPKQTLAGRATEVVGGALAGFGLGQLRRGPEGRDDDRDEDEPVGSDAEEAQAPVAEPEKPLAESVESIAEPEKPIEEPDGSVVEPVKGVAVPTAIDPTDAEPAATSDAPVVEDAPAVEDDVASAKAIEEPTTATSTAEAAPTVDAGADPSLSAPVGTEPKSILEAAEPKVRNVPLQHSEIVYQETEPISPPPPLAIEKSPEPVQPSSDLPGAIDLAPEPELPLAAAAAAAAATATAAAAPLAVQSEEPQDLNFSSIESQDFEPDALPETPPTPLLPKRSSRRLDAIYAAGAAQAGNEPSTAASVPPPHIHDESASVPASRALDGTDKSVVEPKVLGGVPRETNGVSTHAPPDEEDAGTGTDVLLHDSLRDVAPIAAQVERPVTDDSLIPITKPLQIKKQMADEGSQTVVSGNEINNILRNKTKAAVPVVSTGVSPLRPAAPAGQAQQRLAEITSVDDAALLARGIRRPGSAGSTRNKAAIGTPPPLPADYTEKITAASQRPPGSSGTATSVPMGPPLMPASAYKQTRPRTPVDRPQEQTLSRDGTTPRPARPKDTKSQVQSPAVTSRRTSVSSFASELDERFNITRGNIMYPSDVKPSIDPRMIQAITQTMIGEFLWKYTRKAGRSEASTTRHRRFFWVHPYTRTLYWSEQDPSVAGRNMVKAKSVSIQAVRIVTDDNSYPPGLHRKSIVVVTPGREIIFTTPTSQRHETWFNALSYLLVRAEQENEEAEDTVNQDDIDEFNPGGFSIRRSISRMTGRDRSRSRGRASLSSYNSRTTRTTSPQHRDVGGSLAQRQSATTATQARPTITPTPPPAGSTASRTSTVPGQGNVSVRFSSITSKFRPPSSQRGSYSSRLGRSSVNSRTTGDPSEIYDASVVNESAEDLRAVMERQEKEADRVENVRACCDGKHDVGSLPRTGKRSSFSSRFSGGSQPHSHAHQRDSLRPR